MDNTIRTSMKVTLGHLRDVRGGRAYPALPILKRCYKGLLHRPSALQHFCWHCSTLVPPFWSTLCVEQLFGPLYIFYTVCETRLEKSDEQKQLLAYHVSNEPHQPIVYPLEWLLAIRFICSSGTDVARLIFTSWWPDVGRAWVRNLVF